MDAFEMKYRIRTWCGEAALPDLDVKTDSLRVAQEEVRDRIAWYGADDVSLIRPGHKPLKGSELEDWLEVSAIRLIEES
jgi:hypothetical protein